MRIAASSRHYWDEYPSELALEHKMEIFHDRVLGWQLLPAQELADKIPHSGFAVLHVVMSYFETLAKFRDGECSTRGSARYFKEGFEWVFSEQLSNLPYTSRDELIRKVYEEIRCGLYHAGITGTRIMLSGDFPSAVDFQFIQGKIYIHVNPHKIVQPLKQHLMSYLEALNDPINLLLRVHFERRFDWLASDQDRDTWL